MCIRNIHYLILKAYIILLMKHIGNCITILHLGNYIIATYVSQTPSMTSSPVQTNFLIPINHRYAHTISITFVTPIFLKKCPLTDADIDENYVTLGNNQC